MTTRHLMEGLPRVPFSQVSTRAREEARALRDVLPPITNLMWWAGPLTIPTTGGSPLTAGEKRAKPPFGSNEKLRKAEKVPGGEGGLLWKHISRVITFH